MANENVFVLNPDELIREIGKQGASIASMMNNQWATLQLLEGTQLMAFGMHSQFFSTMLGELVLQSNLVNAQLGEQQLYDAAALEGASAMYLLLSALSGDVAKMAEYLAQILNYDNTTTENVGKILPLLSEMGGGSTLNDGVNTAFSAVEAVGSLKTTGSIMQGTGGVIKGVGNLFKGATGIAGLIGSIVPLLSTALPFLIGGAAVLGIGSLIFNAVKSKKTAEENATPAPAVSSNLPPMADNRLKSKEEYEREQAEQAEKAEKQLIDPFNTGEGENSAYAQYQNQAADSHETAEVLREAVTSGNAQVAAQLGEVAEMLKMLAEKPSDRSVKSEIIINSLQTTATMEQFIKMLEQVLEEGRLVTA